jgi:gliding motility-associated-like protein
MTATYTLTVTLNGCIDTDEVTVFVNEVPPVNLGADLTICPGETVTLDATVPGPFVLQYQWSTGETTNSINVTPLVNSTYTITVTDPMSGFSSIDTILISLGSLPLGQPIISGPGEGCLQEIYSYSSSGVSGVTSYAWIATGGAILSGQGTPGVNIQWTSTGPQSLMLIVANDCGALPAVNFNADVLVPPVLPGPVSGLIDPCVYSPTGYSVAVLPSASLYNWTITGGGFITSGQGTASVVVDWNGAVSGRICVEALNICGVSSPVCLDVMPTQSPVISAGPDLETCDQVLALQGSGGGTWNIVSGNGMLTITDTANPQTTVNSPPGETYMLVYESGAAGCEASDTTVVTFHASPAISQVIEVCSNDLSTYAVSFQISGGQSPYLVNGALIASNPFVSGQIPAGTAYNFQAEDSNGCLSAIITGDQSCDCISGAGVMDTTTINACIGDSLIAMFPSGFITGPGDTLAFILHDGQIPGGIIAWGFNPAFSFPPSLQAGQTYYISAVTGVKGANGLPDTADPCFSWSAGTPFKFYNPPVIDIVDLETIGCDPQQVQLDIGGSSSGPGYQYSWTTTNGGMITGATNTDVVQAGSAGTYQLTIVHTLSGCRSTGEIIVIQDHVDLDQLMFEVDPPFCAGDCNGQMMILQSGPNWLFDFGDGVFTNSILPAPDCAGSYVLMVKNEAGCIADTAYTIPDAPLLSVDLGPDRIINPGESLQLQASSDGNIAEYFWLAADTCTTCAAITIHPEVTTIYEIEVVDDHGCMATDQVLITVRVSKDIFLPNVFSPNGDQVNDELYIPPHRSLNAISRFEIFDRWGTLVFHATDQVPGSQGTKWNGAFRETIMNPGVYTCIAELEFGDGSMRRVVWDATLIR